MKSINLRYVAESKNNNYFFYFNEPYSHTDENPAANSSNWKALWWDYNNVIIKIEFEKGTIVSAQFDSDKEKIIIVYDNRHSKQYPAPNNCVVYNIDGTIHKIISTPVLKTLDENGNFIKGHHFDSVGWTKNKQNKTVLFLRVDEREWDWVPWYEDIEFNPETGEFGDLIWRATH